MLSSESLLRQVITAICAEGFGTTLCEHLYYALLGHTPSETNKTLVPVVSLHAPAGAAFKEFDHYVQEVNSGIS